MKNILLRNPELLENGSGPRSDQLFVRSQAVVSRRVAGETLIVPVRGKVGDLASIYSFNGTGSLIWDLLQSPTALSDLIGAVEQEYHVASEKAREDVTRFLNDMLSVGLVEVRPGVATMAQDTIAQDIAREMTAAEMTAAEPQMQEEFQAGS
jgi:coenzyme PQQ synthesis protein D (PqqD)